MKSKVLLLLFTTIILLAAQSIAQQSHQTIEKDGSNFKISYDSCTVILDKSIPDTKKWIAILSNDNFFIKHFQRIKAVSKFTIIIASFDKGRYPPDLYEMKMYFSDKVVTKDIKTSGLPAENYLVTIKKAADARQRIIQIAFIGKKLNN